MKDSITIEKVQLSDPRTIEERSIVTGKEQQVIDVTITVRNQSVTEDYYLISDLREVNYDPVSHTLFLGLIDESRNQVDLQCLLVPSVITLMAGAVTNFGVVIPMILRRLKFPISIPPKEEAIDISLVEHVQCRIAFHDIPPLIKQPDSGKIEINYSLPWGQFVEATFDVGLP